MCFDQFISKYAASFNLSQNTTFYSNPGLTEPKAVLAPEPVVEQSTTLAAFLKDFIADGVTLKGQPASPGTVAKWSSTRVLLLECLGSAETLESVTLADAKEFRKWLQKRKVRKTIRSPSGKMAENSIRQRMANCKSMFSYAVREELVPNNPFRNQASSPQENEYGKQNISAEIIDNVIQAAPNAEWRLLIALWRYGGLRKMEPLELVSVR